MVMQELSCLIRDILLEKVQAAAESSAEFRVMFTGLPRHALRILEELLSSDNRISGTPVYLVQPAADGGSDSGWDDLIQARNSTGPKKVIALRFHADAVPGSVSSAFTEFGQSAWLNESDQGSLDNWLVTNPLINACLRRLDEGLDLSELPDEAGRQSLELKTLFRFALQEAEELDGLDREGIHAVQWELVAEALELCARGGVTVTDVVALLGFPVMPNGALDSKQQRKVLHALADRLQKAGGVRQGLEILKQRDGSPVEALTRLQGHLPPECDSARFKACPTRYFRPEHPVPAWWIELHTERLLALLEDEPSSDKAEIRAAPRDQDVLLRPEKGANYWVCSKAPSLLLSSKDDETGAWRPLDSLAEKKVTAFRKQGTARITIPFDGDGWRDDLVPNHLRPVSYAFEHPDFEEAGCRVLVLERYEPGFQLRASGAKKLRQVSTAKKSSHARWKTAIDFSSPGRHQLDIYVDPARVRIDAAYLGDSAAIWKGPDNVDTSETGPWQDLRCQSISSHRYILYLDLEGDNTCVVVFQRLQDGEREAVIIEMAVGEETRSFSSSRFDALISRNQKPGNKADEITVDASHLQVWVQRRLMGETGQEAGARSELLSGLAGTIFSEDHADAPAEAPATGRLTTLRSVSDPRLLANLSLDHVPGEFIQARQAMHDLIIKMLKDSSATHIEELDLWSVVSDPGRREVLENFVSAYSDWLDRDQPSAAWYEVYALFMPASHGTVLESRPTAILLSPLHPLRLSWMCQAQGMLQAALDAGDPCPFPAVLDPSTVPDAYLLSCDTGTGTTSEASMLSLSSSSDYWGVFWNADLLDQLRGSSGIRVLKDLGLDVEGLSSGLAEGQLRRAMDDLEGLACAQALLRVSVASHEAGSRACTTGLAQWCEDSLGENDPWSAVSGRQVVIYDHRSVDPPEPELVSSLARTTEGAIEWYRIGKEDDETPRVDLAILSHLGMVNPHLVRNKAVSALSEGALVRHRLRQNHIGQELVVIESRVSRHAEREAPRSLLGMTRRLAHRLESGLAGQAFQYAPNWIALERAAEGARYCAVASSDTDPSGFSHPEKGTYLWDYDVPALAHHGLQDSGYYLLAQDTGEAIAAIQSTFRQVTSRIELTDEVAKELLAEVSNRGVPSLKNLAAGGAAANGEIGMLAALQLLQPGFGQQTSAEESVFPPTKDGTINLLVPVDPFKDQFDALRRSLMPNAKASRPDLLAISITNLGETERAKVLITPIEVKCRWAHLQIGEQRKAHSQAKSMVALLNALREKMPWTSEEEFEEPPESTLWDLAGRALLAGWIDFGFRVYARGCGWLEPGSWAEYQGRIVNQLIEGRLEVSVDQVGRVFVVHQAPQSQAHDFDGDRFQETFEVGWGEVTKLLADAAERPILASRLHQLVGDWGLMAIPRVSHLDESVKTQSGTGNTSIEITSSGETGVDNMDVSPDTKESPSIPIEQTSLGIRFEIGRTEKTLTPRPIYFHPSNTALSHLNLGIVGDMGTGKTQLSKYLITQMFLNQAHNRGRSPRFLIFDYKKDYSQRDFVHAVGAKVIAPEDIPLNIMALPPREDGAPHKRLDWVKRANFLIDTLKRIYGGIGPVQGSRLKGAVVAAYQSAAGTGCFPNINRVYEHYMAEGKEDSVSSILANLVDMQIFTDDPAAVVEFEDFLSGVTVVQLHKLGADEQLKNTLVVFFLSLFYEFMIRQEKRQFVGRAPQLRFIEAMLLVDEADNIMKHNFGVLRQILLEGREFGVGVVLASQYLSHFGRGEYDYREPLLTWFIHKVPNVSTRELEGLGLTTVDMEIVNGIKSLDNHEFFCRTLGEDGTFAMGQAFWRLYEDAWRSQNEKAWVELQEAHAGSAERFTRELRSAMELSPPDVKRWLENKR